MATARIKFYKRNKSLENGRQQEKEELEAKLDEKTERWVYLNDLAERIEAQNAR